MAALIGLNLGITWAKSLKKIVDSISSAMSAIIILLLIGALAGTWLISGIVPAMIYYGLDVLSPNIFLLAACIICAFVSLATGSSWSTVATVGIALLGIGTALGVGIGWTAGAIISGAYFGDKMSPLSDTTNLAPAVAGTDLITHIKHMAWTTGPSIIIALIVFLIVGFTISGNTQQSEIEQVQALMAAKFNITPWLFLVPAVVLFLIYKRMPAIPALLIGTLLGGFCAIIFQSNVIAEVAGNIQAKVISANSEAEILSHGTFVLQDGTELVVDDSGITQILADGGAVALFAGNYMLEDGKEITVGTDNFAKGAYTACIVSMTEGFSFEAENGMINDIFNVAEDNRSDLLSGKGMVGMLNTVWLIICALAFGGAMQAAGLLKRITDGILTLVNSTGSLIAATTGTCIFFNLTASDQYLAIVVPGKMYADEFKDRGLAAENLSRTLEDTGTVTSVLIPWNTCGQAQSGVLGVDPMVFAPYCVFNYVSPIMTLLFGFMGWKINELKEVASNED